MMQARGALALATLCALLCLAVSGCTLGTQRPEDDDMTPSSSAPNNSVPAAEEAAVASSDNIAEASVTRVRSGLGVGLNVSVQLRTSAMSAEELAALLSAVASFIPDDIGVVQFVARDDAGKIFRLTEVGKELAIPALNTNSSAGEVTIPAADLREAFPE